MARKVLFVDDDEILQLVMQKALAVHEKVFELVSARDGLEALKKLETHGVSLIVIDLLMPRMDGLSSLSHIRESYPDVPVVLISATPQEEIHHFLEMEGIFGYLEKPFGGAELADMILEVLHGEASGGIMRGISPTMFLQLMEMEEKTCTIRVLERESGEGGVLYLREGRIIDARIGTLRGFEGACRLFAWDKVNVYFHSSCPAIENRVNRDMQAVIMEALAIRDEAEAQADVENVAEYPGSPAQADSVGVHADMSFMGTVAGQAPEVLRLKDILHREVGETEWLCAAYHDPCLERIMKRLSILGEQANFGGLRVGYVDNSQSASRILVPGTPGNSAVLQVEKEAPLTTIIDLFRYQDAPAG